MHLRSLVFSPAVHPAILPYIRRFTTPSYDIFKKLKDSSDGGDSSSQSASAGRRKPSDRVIRLVDEILNLTLIESADLCDLCQERLAGPNVNGGFIPGRSPFPHPHTFFSGVGMMPERLSPMGVMPQPVAATVETAEPPPAETPQPTKPAQKSTGTLTLVGFDATKKIALIKLVRTITGLGLRESKELVESAPRQLKKDLPLEEVQKLAQDLEAAGATIKID
ncbi:Ribosomal protein L7/L12 C-terminal family protein [Babesia bovis T2Bo]|uniref:Ribosomal protein L7/L12 n=1 Tax=Babesia bovis TaxID=5865 RepID=A7AVY0_BABBO|nr:Ribosomal protein L7/L12 C-terminal family protein [Babesia bovis T2Bo]EDO05956.1 Ribosomal protein L7/L12 C-terminal family protein [Babesia bovis T2Bo]|eukprot:XP_001609524.1 ribosomal protein L7/L12 [Babesia bovis T2Bo]